MEDNKTQIIRKFEELKGQFVINCSWKIERLVAVGEDDMDYYWITYNGRKFRWNTCVGGLMPLKGYLRDKDYNEMVRLANLNHWDQVTRWGHENVEEAEQFGRDHKNELTTLPKDHRFLTDVCWELNKIENNG
jgi:hypothetical protein